MCGVRYGSFAGVAWTQQFFADGIGEGMVAPNFIHNWRADCLGLRRTTVARTLRTVSRLAAGGGCFRAAARVMTW